MPGTGSLGVRFDELPHNLPTFCSTVLPGRVLKLNQELYTVVGVMPAGFVLAEKTDIFIPLLLDSPNGSSGKDTTWAESHGSRTV
jgi:hypothetical protein